MQILVEKGICFMDLRIANEIYQDIFTKIEHVNVDLFLCGGASGKTWTSARDQIKADLIKNPQLSILYPEDLFMEILSRKKYDLLTLEKFLANNSDVILIVCESPGSFTELGAFVNNAETVEKVVVLIKTKYKNAKSFIMQGPVEYVKARNKNNIIFYNNDIEDAIAKINNYLRINLGVGSARKRKLMNKDINLITGQFNFIILLLYFFRAIEIKDLSKYIKELYSVKGYQDGNCDLIYASAVRRLFKDGLIKKEEVKDGAKQYLLTEKGFYFACKLLSCVATHKQTHVIDGIRMRILYNDINN